MNTHHRFWSRAAFALCLATAFCYTRPALAKEGYEMTVQTATAGNFDVAVTADAIYLNNRALGYELVARSPNWKIIGFKRGTKTKNSCSLPEYEKLCAANPGSWATSDLGKPISCQKRKVGEKHFGWDYVYGGSKNSASTMVFGTGSAGNMQPVDHYLVKTVDLGLAPQACRIAQASFFLPPTNGWPLEINEFFKSGKVCWVMRQAKMRTLSEMAESTFAVPSNYKDAGKLTASFFVILPAVNMDGAFENLNGEGAGTKNKAKK